MICCWAQEFWGYQFSVVYRNQRMMADVDALTRRFVPIIATHCLVADILHKRDDELRPLDYQSCTCHNCATFRFIYPNMVLPILPILFFDDNNSAPFVVNIPVYQAPIPTISSCPIIFLVSHGIAPTVAAHSSRMAEVKFSTVAKSLFSEWWCLDDYFGSPFYWSTNK